jgi:hypothetical protein
MRGLVSQRKKQVLRFAQDDTFKKQDQKQDQKQD